MAINNSFNSEGYYQILRETKMLVELFLSTNESDISLANRTGFSSSTIGRRLTNKSVILQAFPENGEEIYQKVMEQRRENLLRGKLIGSQVSQMNYSMNDLPRLSLIIFGLSKENQLKLLMHLALTFRVKIGLLASLFRIDENELLNNLLDYSKNKDGLRGALRYLTTQDRTDQNLAMQRLVNFYYEYINAIRGKNNLSKEEVMRTVTDEDAQKLANEKHEFRNKISEKEIKIMLNYHLKYALKLNQTANIFNVPFETLSKTFDKFVTNDAELSQRYEDLLNYNVYLKKLSSESWHHVR